MDRYVGETISIQFSSVQLNFVFNNVKSHQQLPEGALYHKIKNLQNYERKPQQ